MADSSGIIGLATGVIVAGAVVGALDRVSGRNYPRRKKRRVYEYDILGRRI